jgi:AcrR family transcriptional regulator
MTAARTLSTKGKATRLALEDAARQLFVQKGFHGTTLADITAAAGRSPAAFYRYFDDKEDLLTVLAESFLREVVEPSHRSTRLPESPDDMSFFVSAVTEYWDLSKRNIGILVAVDQLAATNPRFAQVLNKFRRVGMDIIRTSVLRAQQHGSARELDVEHVALAIALLFEQFTTVCLRPDTGGLGARPSDAEAIWTLATIWKRTLYGF